MMQRWRKYFSIAPIVNISLILVSLTLGLLSIQKNRSAAKFEREVKRLELLYGSTDYPDENKVYVQQIPCDRAGTFMWRVHMPKVPAKRSFFVKLGSGGSGTSGKIDAGDQIWVFSVHDQNGRMSYAFKTRHEMSGWTSRRSEQSTSFGQLEAEVLAADGRVEIGQHDEFSLLKAYDEGNLASEVVISTAPVNTLFSSRRK